MDDDGLRIKEEENNKLCMTFKCYGLHDPVATS